MSVAEAIKEGLTDQELDILADYKPGGEYLSRALGWAIVAHRGQKRKSGELYVHHVIEVSNLLESWGLRKPEIQAAALLHDTIEDSDTTFDDLASRWGDRVATWVKSVSKFSSNLETLKHVTTRALVDSVTGVVKLADRLHNMRTLRFMSPQKQVEISRETMDVYTELAESLGIWRVREELSDLAFSYLEPETYKKIDQEISADPRTRESCYGHFKSKIELLMSISHMEGTVGARFKGRYSTYKKRERLVYLGKCSPNDLKGISDLVSIGVTLTNREDCYRFLDKIHNDWSGQVLVTELKDNIGNPADNGYMALQTIILTPDGPMEIAIMTSEMKDFNDWGIVSKLRHDESARQFTLKPVFMPSNRAVFLNTESTGVDLLCKLDPYLALRKPTLTLDGEVKPLTTVIHPGAVAEVIPTTSEQTTEMDPSLLKYCLPDTERVLRNILITTQERALINSGKSMLSPVIRQRGLIELEDLGNVILERVVREIDKHEGRVKSIDQLYYLLGGKFLEALQVAEALDKLKITKQDLSLSTILVRGAEDKPGVLEKITSLILTRNGNIKTVYTQTENGFLVRVVVKGLSNSAQEEIQELLEQSTYFTQVDVV